MTSASTRIMAASNKELAAKIDQAIKDKEKTLASLGLQKSNPTVAPSYWEAKGALEALEAVRDALKGNMINLNLL